MKRALPLLVLAALLSLGAGPGRWRHPAPGEISGGIPRDISLSSSGSILLAPASEEILPGDGAFSTPPLLVAVETDVEGNTYFGGALGAQVLRVDGKGEIHTFFESSGLAVRALSSDVSGYLLVATMPNGRVYRVDSEGATEVLFEPEERYLWAMATDAFDRTYLATGERGIIYSISGPGDATVFFDSDEPHITSLSSDPTGRLLAGSSGRGLLYRIGTDGNAEVLLDSGLNEISAISVATDGTIYASAILDPGPRRPRRRSNGRDDLTIEVTAADDEEGLEETTGSRRKVVVDLSEILPAAQDPTERGLVSKIYRISPGRTPMVIWSSATEWVYSLALNSRGHLLMGTGPSGRLYRLEPDETATLVRQYPATHITALTAGARGETWILTSNPGRVYRMDSEPSESGQYLSSVHDAGNIASWGTLRWEADLPKGTRISMTSRSGNTPLPDGTWSGWSDSMTEPDGSTMESPPARYVQWRATLSRLKTETTPVLRSASMTYLPENLAPEIRAVRIGTAGEKPGDGAPGPVPPGESGKKDAEESAEGRWLWVSWNSSDPDGDPLRHTISLRREDDTAWMALAREVKEQQVRLDPAGHPEGRYVARIDVSDQEINGAERGRTASSRSAPFLIDNTPPVIDTEEPAMAEESVSLSFSAVDALSPVERAEWALSPDGPWTTLLPRDGISDTESEFFALTLSLEGLGRRISLRVADTAGNRATREIELPRWQ